MVGLLFMLVVLTILAVILNMFFDTSIAIIGPELIKFIAYKDTHQFATTASPKSIRGLSIFGLQRAW